MTDSEDPRSRPRIAFVVNNVAFFMSHRLPIALAARDAGCEVMLFTGQAGSRTLEDRALADLAATGIAHRAVAFGSSSMNLFDEACGLAGLVSGLRRFRPDVVHCVSPKGVLYGGLAARLLRTRGLVLAVSGMGFLFTGAASGWKSILRRGYQVVVSFAYGHRNKRVIVQNRDDLDALSGAGLARESELVLIPGSGVPLERYAHLDGSAQLPLVVLPARMLRDKGVAEFAQAAKALREAGCDWRFALVGTADYRNPSAIPMEDIEAWVQAGSVEWWGHRHDMVEVFAQASIVCLPSYREGMPKALLEAAAAGCAVVTTDVIGCREAVENGVTGDLVPPQDAQALAHALSVLIADAPRRAAYGRAGKRRAVERFSLKSVVDRTLSIYQELNQRVAH